MRARKWLLRVALYFDINGLVVCLATAFLPFHYFGKLNLVALALFAVSIVAVFLWFEGTRHKFKALRTGEIDALVFWSFKCSVIAVALTVFTAIVPFWMAEWSQWRM